MNSTGPSPADTGPGPMACAARIYGPSCRVSLRGLFRRSAPGFGSSCRARLS